MSKNENTTPPSSGLDIPIDEAAGNPLWSTLEGGFASVSGGTGSPERDAAFPKQYDHLPPGQYWVKRDENGALTEPITVPPGVEYLKTDPKGQTVSDPVAAAQMSEYADVKRHRDSSGSRAKPQTWGEMNQDEKKQVKTGFIILGVLAVIVTLVLMAIFSGGDENDDSSPASATAVVTETSEEEEATEEATEVSDDAVPMAELENEKLLELLDVTGVDRGEYTDDELFEMGRNACTAVAGNGGDIGLTLEQLVLIMGAGREEEEYMFAGKMVAAAIYAYCPEYIPNLDEFSAE